MYFRCFQKLDSYIKNSSLPTHTYIYIVCVCVTKSFEFLILQMVSKLELCHLEQLP